MARTIDRTGGPSDERGDDAPPATSKRSAVRDAATEALIEEDGALVRRSILINRSRIELYAFWRDVANLARFMDNIERVTPIDAVRSHWVVKGPGDTLVEWDSRVTEDEPGAAIAWESEPDAEVRNAGRVEFREAPGGRGTIVTATIAYDPPAGMIGRLVAKLFRREPGIQARRDLRRFKQLMEAGEIATAARTADQRDEDENKGGDRDEEK